MRDYDNEIPPIECVGDCLKFIREAVSANSIDKIIVKYNELASKWNESGYSWEEGKRRLSMGKARLDKLKQQKDIDEIPFEVYPGSGI